MLSVWTVAIYLHTSVSWVNIDEIVDAGSVIFHGCVSALRYDQHAVDTQLAEYYSYCMISRYFGVSHDGDAYGKDDYSWIIQMTDENITAYRTA